MRSYFGACLLVLSPIVLGACASKGSYEKASMAFEQRAEELESTRMSAMLGIHNEMILKDNELQKELSELKVSYGQLERYIQTLEEENASLRARVETHATDTGARLEGLESSLAEIKTKREDNGETYRQVTATLEKVGEFSTRLAENENKLQELQGKADQLAADLGAESQDRE